MILTIILLVLALPLSFLLVNGALDVYAYIRFKKKGAGKIDQTASFGHWITLKWMLASQTDLIAEKLPFVKQDLSEVVGVKKDDGDIS